MFISCNRKASLTLMRKMVHYMSAEALSEMCGVHEDGTPKLFPSQLVDVMASVLDNEVCVYRWSSLIALVC